MMCTCMELVRQFGNQISHIKLRRQRDLPQITMEEEELTGQPNPLFPGSLQLLVFHPLRRGCTHFVPQFLHQSVQNQLQLSQVSEKIQLFTTQLHMYAYYTTHAKHTLHLEMQKPSGRCSPQELGPGGMQGAPRVTTPKTLSGYRRAKQ